MVTVIFLTIVSPQETHVKKTYYTIMFPLFEQKTQPYPNVLIKLQDAQPSGYIAFNGSYSPFC